MTSLLTESFSYSTSVSATKLDLKDKAVESIKNNSLADKKQMWIIKEGIIL